LNPDGRTTKKTQQKKVIEIKPGYGEDFILRFKGEGNMSPGKEISDLILKIVTRSCKGFTREGNDLVYTVKTPLLDALTARPIQIETLDGRILKVALDSVVR